MALNLKLILHAILEEYELPWDGLHGVAHWARVLENGLRLADETGAGALRARAVRSGWFVPARYRSAVVEVHAVSGRRGVWLRGRRVRCCCR